MKIADVKAHVLKIPFCQESIPAPDFQEGITQVVTEIVTDEGISGYGEAFGLGVPQATASVVEELFRPMLLGRNPLCINELQDIMFRKSHIWGRYGVTTFALSGVEIALWDLAGRYAGLPLHRLLGGAGSESLPAYASLVNYRDIDQLAQMVAKAKSEGFGAVKIHQTDLLSVAKARSVLGDAIDLMVDVNCPWTPRQALQMEQAMREYSLTWLEEPIWPPEDFQSLAQLRTKGRLPIALGENLCTAVQFQAAISASAADYLQPSVVKVGGITEWLKVAALAQTHNIPLVPHSFYLGPGYLATAQLLSVTPGALYIEDFYVQPETTVFGVSLRSENGRFAVPQGPGLGMDIDTAVLMEYRLHRS